MLRQAINALADKLSPHIELSKSRLETLCFIVAGMASARTVNLSHLACEMTGEAQITSNYRRLQSFFRSMLISGPTGQRVSSLIFSA